MSILRQLIESYETEPGKGLPIGNLTSQYFANLYLDGLDRFLSKPGDDVREQTNAVDSIRYMDDVLVFGSHEALRRIMRAVPTFLQEALKLQLKAKGGLHRTTRGVEFLGTRVFPRHVGLSRRSKIRFRRKVALLDGMLAAGRMSERRYQIRMTQLFAFVRNCDTEELRRRVISEGAQGELSPRARRVLEQQQQRGLCRRLPQRVSEQQLQQHEPEQQQQQLGLSRLLFPRSSRAENENRLNRSPSRIAGFGGQTQNMLCGAGRQDAERHVG